MRNMYIKKIDEKKYLGLVYFVEKTSKHLTCHFHLLNALLPFCDCVSLIKWFIYENFYWMYKFLKQHFYMQRLK